MAGRASTSTQIQLRRVARITDFSFSRSLLPIERANFFPFTTQNNTEGAPGSHTEPEAPSASLYFYEAWPTDILSSILMSTMRSSRATRLEGAEQVVHETVWCYYYDHTNGNLVRINDFNRYT
jgi:hypothetical protein